VTYRPAPVPPGAAPSAPIEARLEPDAIGVAQDTVIGMASSAPAGTMAATLAALAVASASQRWALAGVVAAGVIVMGYARLVLRSVFFHTPRESA
jgi:hypothetical protein